MGSKKSMSTVEKLAFYSKQGPNGCILWTGSKNNKGYGYSSFEGVLMLAHRAAYIVAKGPIPAGLFVCHRCDVQACINPDHLWLGTHQDNMDDKSRKNRVCVGEANGISKLTNIQVLEIRASRESVRTLAKRMGVAHSTISQVKSFKRWAHVSPTPKHPTDAFLKAAE